MQYSDDSDDSDDSQVLQLKRKAPPSPKKSKPKRRKKSKTFNVRPLPGACKATRSVHKRQCSRMLLDRAEFVIGRTAAECASRTVIAKHPLDESICKQWDEVTETMVAEKATDMAKALSNFSADPLDALTNISASDMSDVYTKNERRAMDLITMSMLCVSTADGTKLLEKTNASIREKIKERIEQGPVAETPKKKPKKKQEQSQKKLAVVLFPVANNPSKVECIRSWFHLCKEAGVSCCAADWQTALAQTEFWDADCMVLFVPQNSTPACAPSELVSRVCVDGKVAICGANTTHSQDLASAQPRFAAFNDIVTGEPAFALRCDKAKDLLSRAVRSELCPNPKVSPDVAKRLRGVTWDHFYVQSVVHGEFDSAEVVAAEVMGGEGQHVVAKVQ